MSEVWPVVHAERAALIQDLRPLGAEQWATPSLCTGWDVHDVLAHLVDDARTTRSRFLRRLILAGFDFDRVNTLGIMRERASDPADTLDAFEAARLRTTSAPAPAATRLVETIVHGEDIRRPLGIDHAYPADAVIDALQFQARTSVKIGGGRERLKGLRLHSTDADCDVGSGQKVYGSAIALLLAVSGRPVRPGELTGPGAMALMVA